MTNFLKSSAIIYDRVIGCLDKIASVPDIVLALEEFGLGVPQSIRQIDVGFGCIPILGDASHSNDTIEISPGQARYYGQITPASGTQLIVPSDNLGSIQLQNVYGFGSIYMTAPGIASPFSPPYTFTSAPVLTVSLAVGVGQSSIAPPLLMVRDVNSDMISQWLSTDITPPGRAPSGDSLELVRFVLDIDTYIGSGSPLNMIRVYIRDVRRIRGFGGFAEEVMATTLLPTLITYDNEINIGVTEFQLLLSNSVQTWVDISDWSPDFVTYWNTNGTLPARLKLYLQTELGLGLT